MLVDGEKYACEACVRGHRVSNCQHSDRPLTHINKKGRPVSQCPHCRVLRKSRASHVKCDCGEKPHSPAKCYSQFETSDSISELGDNSAESGSDLGSVDPHTCCCSHGARCTCALKKEHLDPVPEVDITDTPQPRSTLDFRRPQLTTTPSENSLIVFSNGHHKPAHKHNDAARKCGAPYSIPRPHSIHGHSDIAQKSMDHLPLVRNTEEARSQFQESISSAQQEVRLVRSEHNSPQSRAVLTVDELNRHIPPLDLSFPTYDDNPSSPFGDDYTYQPANVLETYFPTSEEQPVLSAGLNMPAVNWTAFDLPLDNNAFSSTCSQPPSYASFEYSNIGQPGLTTSSSGEVSEAEDYMPHGGPSPPIPGPNHIVSNSPDAAESEIYRLSSASSYLSLPQASLLAASNIDKLDIDAFLHATATCPGDFEVHNLATTADADRFSRHGFTVRDAQKLAHPCVPTEAMGDLSLPTPNDNINPPWASSFNGEDPSLDPELDIPDSPWAS